MFQLPMYQAQVNSNQFPLFDFLKSLVSFSSEIAWLLVGFVGIFFIVYSLILSYHWNKFGLDAFVMARASLIYYLGSAVLWVVIIASLFIYLSSI